MTIQHRLTVAFVALIAVVVAGLGAFEAFQLRGFLIESAAVRLRAQAKPTIEARFQDGENVREVAGSLAVDLNSRYTGALIYHRAGDVTLPPADPVDAPPPLPVPLIPLRQAFNGEKEAIAKVEASYGGRMLAVFIPLPPMPAATEQQAEAVAVLGESLAGVDDVVRQHALIAGLNLVIACGLGGLVGPSGSAGRSGRYGASPGPRSASPPATSASART